MDATKNLPAESAKCQRPGIGAFSLIFNRREFAEVMYWIKSQCPGGKMAELLEKWA